MFVNNFWPDLPPEKRGAQLLVKHQDNAIASAVAFCYHPSCKCQSKMDRQARKWFCL